jgi:hypothetical protein
MLSATATPVRPIKAMDDEIRIFLNLFLPNIPYPFKVKHNIHPNRKYFRACETSQALIYFSLRFVKAIRTPLRGYRRKTREKRKQLAPE